MSGVAYTLELTSVIQRSAKFASQAPLSRISSSALQVEGNVNDPISKLLAATSCGCV